MDELHNLITYLQIAIDKSKGEYYDQSFIVLDLDKARSILQYLNNRYEEDYLNYGYTDDRA